MPNDLTTNPWIIDTASGTPLTLSRMRVTGIRWVGATTAGHVATIKDGAARTVWESVAAGVNYVEADHTSGYRDKGLDVAGLAVTALGSGKIYIEYA